MKISLPEGSLRKSEGKIINKKIPLSQEIKRSIYLLVFTLLGIIVVLGAVFLLNTSQATQKGYILKKEQIDKDQSLLMNRDLVNKIIEAQSFKTIEEKIMGKKMGPVENLTYIKDNKK